MRASIAVGRLLHQETQAPLSMFATLSTTLVLFGTTPGSKYHRGTACAYVHVPSYRSRTVLVDAATVPPSRVCTCLHYATFPEWDPVMAPAGVLAALVRATRSVRASAGDGWDRRAVNELRGLAASADEANAALLSALAQAGATAAAQSEAAAWARTAIDAAAELLTDVDQALGTGPDRALREAAHLLLPSIDAGFDARRHSSLADRHSLHRGIADRANQALTEALADGATPAEIRRRVLATLDAVALTDLDLRQIPNVPTPAAPDLHQAILQAWRAAAEAALVELVASCLDTYREDLADSAPAILLTDSEPVGQAAGLLLGYPRRELPYPEDDDAVVHAWVVPAVIGRAAARVLSGDVLLPAAPLPGHLAAGLPADGSPVPEHVGQELLGSDYVTTLLRLICVQGLDADEATVAARGIVEPRDRAAS